jgi:hypothetical protein
MTMQLRLVVGGLPRGLAAHDMQHLLAPCGESRFELLDDPGHADETMAIVHLGADQRLAERLRQRLDHRRVDGQRLWTWLTVLPWR